MFGTLAGTIREEKEINGDANRKRRSQTVHICGWCNIVHKRQQILNDQ